MTEMKTKIDKMSVLHVVETLAKFTMYKLVHTHVHVVK